MQFRSEFKRIAGLTDEMSIHSLLERDLGHTVEPLNNGHIGGRDFVPCREVVHYRRSTIFLLIISLKITFQWLNEVTFNEMFTNQLMDACMTP